MIKLGTTNIRDVFNGTTDILKVMYGTNLVWEKLIVIDLGTRKFDNYDITSYYSNYGSLTKDNFFVVNMNNASGSSRVVVNGSTLWLRITGELIKSYNASTGKLTCYNQCSGNISTGTGNVHVVLIPNPDKLVSLGSAQSFNVSNQQGYKNFTADNFLIKNVTKYTENHSRTYDGTWTASATTKLYKNYNASKGLLTCYYYEEGTSNANSDSTDFKFQKMNAEVYLKQ